MFQTLPRLFLIDPNSSSKGKRKKGKEKKRGNFFAYTRSNGVDPNPWSRLPILTISCVG
jgi:hypothetical protein